jgi:glycosyltransferase involved in cell wall biosynthesis
MDSLRFQTYENCQFILVDDGSTDESLKICLEQQNKDKRFNTITQSNQGVAAARNLGLDYARGDFVGFVDSDDFIDLRMIEKMVSSLLLHTADFVECSVNLLNEDFSVRASQILSDSVLTSNDAIVKGYAMQQNVLNYTCNKIFRSKVIEDVRFPIRRASEDYSFNVAVLNQCHKSITLSEPLYNYVLHPESATGKSFHIGRLDSVTCGIDVLNLQKERFPSLIPYYAIYILEKIMVEFMYVHSSVISRDLKKSIKSDLISKFRLYFSFVTQEALSKANITYRYKHYMFFRLLPILYVRIF